MNFNAKILLFGEYTVLHGSDALLIPFTKFSGKFEFFDNSGDSNKVELNKALVDLFIFLKGIELGKSFNLSQLKADIDSGLFFDSSIPTGYGVGSSGALVAALFNGYFRESTDSLSIQRNVFATIESFFHGVSSGLDPLVSHLNKGVYLKDDDLQIKDFNISAFHPFLIDTGKTRSTGNLVKLFRDKSLDPKYLAMIKNELIVYNNLIIKSLIDNNGRSFFNQLKALSSLQFKHFKEMILPEFEPIWKLGLESDDFYLKLCGAGGGGYIIGFAEEYESIKNLINNSHLSIIEI
jgi:mevalonate kinase